MKRIVITGGSGFIGGYVFRRLKAAGYPVINFDLKGHENRRRDFVQGSILDFDAVSRAVERADIVMHFAGFSNINQVKADPLSCISLNILGTANILEALHRKGGGHLVFASSVYVHDRRGHLYTTSKCASERICFNYSDLYNIPTTIIRIGTAYGEQSRHEDVVSLFAKRASDGGPLCIYGSGKQRRHFIHGEDIAEACEQIIRKDACGQTLILAGKKGISVNQLARVVQNAVPYVTISWYPDLAREDDYEGDIGEVATTYTLLEWKPKISIEEGVVRMIRHFQSRQ